MKTQAQINTKIRELGEIPIKTNDDILRIDDWISALKWVLE